MDSDSVLNPSTTFSSIENPASKVQRLGSSIQSSDSRIRHPDSSIQSPVSSVQIPVSRVQQLDSSVQYHWSGSSAQRLESRIQCQSPLSNTVVQSPGISVCRIFLLFVTLLKHDNLHKQVVTECQ